MKFLRQLPPLDTDDDGISDYVDNAPCDANAPRLDMNADGALTTATSSTTTSTRCSATQRTRRRGSAWAIRPIPTTTTTGCSDGADNCPFVANADQADADARRLTAMRAIRWTTAMRTATAWSTARCPATRSTTRAQPRPDQVEPGRHPLRDPHRRAGPVLPERVHADHDRRGDPVARRTGRRSAGRTTSPGTSAPAYEPCGTGEDTARPDR